jgi:hypothetical protein
MLPEFETSKHPFKLKMESIDHTGKYRYVFTAKEDEVLKIYIDQFGTNNWEMVARNLPGRSPRQCRERWLSYLSPDINRTPWTADEDGLLFDLLQIHGPKWGVIMGFFCNRTPNNIKNRWNTVNRKGGILGLDPRNRRDFVETGQKIVSRSTRRTFDPPHQMLPASLPEVFSLEHLLNVKGDKPETCQNI